MTHREFYYSFDLYEVHVDNFPTEYKFQLHFVYVELLKYYAHI